MMSRFTRVAAALWAAFVLAAPAQAERIEAEGMAPADIGSARAYRQALQDAEQQAAITQGAQINVTEQLAQGTYSQSGRVEAAAPLRGKVTVLDSFVRDGLFHVRIAVDDGAAGKPAAGAAEQCCPSCRALRRRLITTYFNVERPAAASDLAQLATAMPAEFARRFAALPRFGVRNAGHATVQPAGLDEPAMAADVVRQTGQYENAQFVLSGRVVDTSVTDYRTTLSVLDQGAQEQGDVHYDGPLFNFLGANVKRVPSQRQFDFELWVYDAFTGSLIVRERFADVARIKQATPEFGQPLLPPFGSERFWQTDYGRVIDDLIGKAVRKVDQQLACIPYMSKVVRVEGKNRFYVNGGGLDGLKVGDTLAIYKQQPLTTVRATGSGYELGIPEAQSGQAAIVQLQPDFAIAEVRHVRYPVAVGDLVRLLAKH